MMVPTHRVRIEKQGRYFVVVGGNRPPVGFVTKEVALRHARLRREALRRGFGAKKRRARPRRELTFAQAVESSLRWSKRRR